MGHVIRGYLWAQKSEAEERRAEAEQERRREAEAVRARLEKAASAEKEAKRSLEEHQVEVETLRRKAKLLEASQGCQNPDHVVEKSRG